MSTNPSFYFIVRSAKLILASIMSQFIIYNLIWNFGHQENLLRHSKLMDLWYLGNLDLERLPLENLDLGLHLDLHLDLLHLGEIQLRKLHLDLHLDLGVLALGALHLDLDPQLGELHLHLNLDHRPMV